MTGFTFSSIVLSKAAAAALESRDKQWQQSAVDWLAESIQNLIDIIEHPGEVRFIKTGVRPNGMRVHSEVGFPILDNLERRVKEGDLARLRDMEGMTIQLSEELSEALQRGVLLLGPAEGDERACCNLIASCASLMMQEFGNPEEGLVEFLQPQSGNAMPQTREELARCISEVLLEMMKEDIAQQRKQRSGGCTEERTDGANCLHL